jgi:hypothetical protein
VLAIPTDSHYRSPGFFRVLVAADQAGHKIVFFSSFKNNANFTKRKISSVVLSAKCIATNVPEMSCVGLKCNSAIVKEKFKGNGHDGIDAVTRIRHD